MFASSPFLFSLCFLFFSTSAPIGLRPEVELSRVECPHLSKGSLGGWEGEGGGVQGLTFFHFCLEGGDTNFGQASTKFGQTKFGWPKTKVWPAPTFCGFRRFTHHQNFKRGRQREREKKHENGGGRGKNRSEILGGSSGGGGPEDGGCGRPKSASQGLKGQIEPTKSPKLEWAKVEWATFS